MSNQRKVNIINIMLFELNNNGLGNTPHDIFKSEERQKIISEALHFYGQSLMVKNGDAQIKKVRVMSEFFKMIEIYAGKDEEWKGYHNLIISDGNCENDFPVAGPIHPEVSQRILKAIDKNNQDQDK